MKKIMLNFEHTVSPQSKQTVCALDDNLCGITHKGLGVAVTPLPLTTAGA